MPGKGKGDTNTILYAAAMMRGQIVAWRGAGAGTGAGAGAGVGAGEVESDERE